MKLTAALRFALILIGLAAASQANAVCSSPAGIAGDIAYSSNINAPVYCDGTTWTSMSGGVGSGGGGTATPAGSTNDIQFNTSGALAADTGNFTYSSGLLTTPRISSTLAQFTSVSLTTGGTNWGYLGAGASYLPNLSSNLVSSTFISSTITQVSGTSLTCTTALKGSIRYSNTSNTLEYCNSTAWVSAGPSDTQVPAFSVHKNGTDQTVTSNVTAALTWSTEAFDTNNNFASNAFTPTIPGKYLLTLSVKCLNTTDYCIGFINKNGSTLTDSRNRYTGGDRTAVSTILVDANGTTDSFTASVYMTGTTVQGAAIATHFSGFMIGGGGSGSGGGTATPAGSTADVQFNTAGALAADTGNFIYASGLLTAPRISTTQISATNVSVTGIIQVSGSAVSCSAGTKGSIRYSNTSNTLEYCNSTAWVSAGPSGTAVPAFSVNKGGTAQTGLANGGYTTLSWSTESYDTNNNFANDRFTPTTPGKYLVTLGVRCLSTTSSYVPAITKNGSVYAQVSNVGGTDIAAQVTSIIDMNGTTDYLESRVYSGGGSASGATADAFFQGLLISMAGGGSTGSSATPAGISGSIQFNSAGALAGRSDIIIDPSGSVGIGTGAPKAALDVSGTVKMAGTGAEACVSNTLGTFRFNPINGVPQICR